MVTIGKTDERKRTIGTLGHAPAVSKATLGLAETPSAAHAGALLTLSPMSIFAKQKVLR